MAIRLPDAVQELQTIFCVGLYDYDYADESFLEGPPMTQEDFQKLCNSLMEQAGRDALAAAHGHDYNIVTPSCVKSQLMKLLVAQGFKSVRPKRAYFNGSYFGGMDNYKRDTERYDPEIPAEAEDEGTIFHQLKDVHKAICEHNQVEYDRAAEKRKVNPNLVY